MFFIISQTTCDLKIFSAICNKLHEMKLIDNSYHISDFEMIRNHYQQALYHLVSAARVSIHEEPFLDISRYL